MSPLLLVTQKNSLRALSTRASLSKFESTHTKQVFVGGLEGRFEACVHIASQIVVPLRELVFGSALCWVQGVVCQLEWCQLPSHYEGRVAAPISRALRLHPSQHGKSVHHTGSAPPLQHACTRAPAQHATIHPASRTSSISAWHISAQYGNSKNSIIQAQVATNARQVPQCLHLLHGCIRDVAVAVPCHDCCASSIIWSKTGLPWVLLGASGLGSSLGRSPLCLTIEICSFSNGQN
jgi:hypothetical protein